MKSKVDHLARFHPDVFYHVYGRTNNQELLFEHDEDRTFFLSTFTKYLSPYVNTYAWCLMSNHYHFLIQIKSAQQILAHLQTIPKEILITSQRHLLETRETDRDFHPVIERQFTRLFTAYAMEINRTRKRNGNLFYRPFKRVEVTEEDHLTWLIYYIHSNPLKHRVLDDFAKYPWSSYSTFLSAQPTELHRAEVLSWFGGLERFIGFHTQDSNLPGPTTYLDIE